MDLETKGNEASNTDNEANEVDKAGEADNQPIPYKLGMYIPFNL